MNDLHEMAANSREAAWTLAASSLETRNAALLRMAETLENHQADIFAANAADIHQAEADGLAAPLLGRLKFREEKLRAVTDGLRALAALPDPIGATTMTHEITPGLKMYRVTCPIGVIGVIFESRPNVTADAGALCLKAGNAVIAARHRVDRGKRREDVESLVDQRSFEAEMAGEIIGGRGVGRDSREGADD